MKKICKNCGVDYQTKGKSFCSPACHKEFRRSKGYSRVECSNCNKTFDKRVGEVLISKNGKHFCTISCSSIYNGAKRGRNKIKCSGCELEIERQPSYVEKYNKSFCTTECQNNYSHAAYIERWLKGEENGCSGTNGTSTHIKRYVLDKQSNKCLKCGTNNSWQGEALTLELDHINGDSKCNKESNLRCLCPNCHSQTDTYRARNKNSTRISYNKRL